MLYCNRTIKGEKVFYLLVRVKSMYVVIMVHCYCWNDINRKELEKETQINAWHGFPCGGN